YPGVAPRTLQPLVQELHGLLIAHQVLTLDCAIDHVEVRILVGLRCIPEHRIGCQIASQEGRSPLFESDQVIEIDAVEIELEVMVMVIAAVIKNGQSHESRERRAVGLIGKLESRGIYMTTDLKEAQDLVGMTQKRSADGAVWHHH